jgi:gliding motility-associated-like protein
MIKRSFYTYLFLVLIGLFCAPTFVGAQLCPNRLIFNSIDVQRPAQLSGGAELMLIPRPDIADSAYEFLVRVNGVNYGSWARMNLPNNFYKLSGSNLVGFYAIVDSCSGLRIDIDTFSVGNNDQGGVFTAKDTLSQNPFTGNSNAVDIHQACDPLPTLPNSFVFPFPLDTFLYKREYWSSRIIYLPYKCGKWQIQKAAPQFIGLSSTFYSRIPKDSNTNIHSPCDRNSLPYISPDISRGVSNHITHVQHAGAYPLIQFSNLEVNNMPHYLSQLDYICPAGQWNSIPANAVDPEGDSLVFSPVLGNAYGWFTAYKGQDQNNYSPGLLPIRIIREYNASTLSFDTLGVQTDTLGEGFDCVPGTGTWPNCVKYNYQNNPFHCDSTYSVNPQTGEIRFKPTTPDQHVMLSVQVDEYRQGRWLSRSHRTIRIHTVDSAYVSNPELVVDTPNVQQAAIGNNLEFFACAGANIRIPFDIKESQSLSQLSVRDDHSTAIPTASVGYQNNNTDSVRGLFTWNTLPTDSGWYSVVYTIKDSACGLSKFIQNTQRVMKIYLSPDGISGIKDTTICEGESVKLFTQGGGSNIQWTVLGGSQNSLSCTNCQNPTTTPNETTTYQAISQLTGGCKARDTVTINVQEEYNLNASDRLVCGPKDSVELSANISSNLATSAQIISWQPTTGIGGSNNLPDIWVDPNVETQYIVSVTDTLGCFFKTDTATITYDKGFSAKLNATETDICLGDTIRLEVQGTGVQSINFIPDYNISSLTGPNVRVWPTEDTTYRAIVKSNSSDCEFTVSKKIEVSFLRADAGPDQEVFDGEDVYLSGPDYRCDNECLLKWFPDTYIVNPGNDNMGRALSRPFETITYVQQLTSTNGGCVDKDTVTIRVKCEDIYMPNVFSPNSTNTNRKNHSFGPNNYGLEIEDFKVFNRWGQLMFQIGDGGQRWSGYHNGKLQPTGVYVWFIKARCANSNELIEKQGNVTLLR